MNVLWQMRARACTRDCMHACVRACLLACVRACLGACVRECMRACVRARVCVLVRVNITSPNRSREAKVCAYVRVCANLLCMCASLLSENMLDIHLPDVIICDKLSLHPQRILIDGNYFFRSDYRKRIGVDIE